MIRLENFTTKEQHNKINWKISLMPGKIIRTMVGFLMKAVLVFEYGVSLN